MTATANNAAPHWAAAVQAFTNNLVGNLGGGPRPWKFSWVINFQKAGTFFIISAR